MNAKKLPPPRGAAQTHAAADMFRNRFTPPDETTVESEPATPDEKPQTPPRRMPDDRVRRTYYLDKDTADALAEAVDRVRDACSGMVPRHQIIAALIRRGLDAETEVVDELKTQLRDRLNLD